MAKKKLDKRTKEYKMSVQKKPDYAIVQKEIGFSDGKIATQIVVEKLCTCQGFDGQDFFCKEHKPTVQCPNCKCIKTEIMIENSLPPMNHYRCSLCGVFYARNLVSGTYDYQK